MSLSNRYKGVNLSEDRSEFLPFCSIEPGNSGMMRHVPPTAVPVNIQDLSHGFNALINPDSAQNDFKRIFSSYQNVSHCYLTSSGRVGIYLALKALKRTSERTTVIAPAYTCPTVVQAIKMAGLKVMLCDLSLDTLGLDRSSLNELIDYSILAIIAVHPFGLVEDMHDLVAIGKQQDIFIIEDAAQSLGARLNQQVVGSWGDISIFSLGRGKVITAGGGGIITTSNQEIAAALDAVIENEVKSPTKAGLNSLALLAGYLIATQPSIWWFIVKSPLNPALESRTASVETFSITNLSASQTGIGHSMMVKLEQINKIRRRNAERLIKALRDLPAVQFPGQTKNSEPIYLRLPVLLDDLEARELLFEQLNSNGIGVSRMYEQPLARTFSKEIDQLVEELPVSDYIAQHLLTLPTHHMLTEDDFSRTIEIFYKQLAV